MNPAGGALGIAGHRSWNMSSTSPPPDRCGGYCADTYVAVTGPHCGGGDSGGPVYDLDLARGLLKGGNYSTSGSCNYYFYMPIAYLSSGWSLLLG
jgi:hypothetical protein